MNTHRHGMGLVLAALALTAMPLMSAPVAAQEGAHTFPETGKTVSGPFWTYWQAHGGLAQQGYPISAEMQEKSDLNGQTYTVQYFERAVFEKHPENQAPYDVLLSQLGTFRYKATYGAAGAPGQQISSENPRRFPETNHTVGGVFRAYWESHGGLAQQGYPISDEFQEKSDLNGQTYTVQYFERAVFEKHPENQAPFDVLLSQLGAFQYKARYQGGGVPTAAPTAPAAPTAAPAPTSPPNPCGDIPAGTNLTVTPACAPAGATFHFEARGFRGHETVGVYTTRPNGAVIGAPFQAEADSDGVVTGISFTTGSDSTPGVYATSMEGVSTHTKAVGYFRVTSASAGPPPSSGCDVSGNRDGEATPSSGKVGDTITFNARGFQAREAVSFWFTAPNGDVVGTARPIRGGVNADGTVGPLAIDLSADLIGSMPGRWALTFQGASSGHQALIFFCVGQ
jgi:hypothetical protein